MPLYSDVAIILAPRTVYRQTLRGTQGLLQSVFELMNLRYLRVPDYSTLCRCARRLEVALTSPAHNGPVHPVVDESSGQINATAINLCSNVEPLKVFLCGWPYLLAGTPASAAMTIAGAKPLPRDENIGRIRAVGRKRWKEEIGYHRRSLTETALFRLKTTFGDHLQSRLFENQATEMFIRCRVLNQMNRMGKPDMIKVVTSNHCSLSFRSLKILFYRFGKPCLAD